ncbi:hypothetical protein [Dishui lake virophage 1]|nr:hypothetical protein [Dishui lake virophage 1]
MEKIERELEKSRETIFNLQAFWKRAVKILEEEYAQQTKDYEDLKTENEQLKRELNELKKRKNS